METKRIEQARRNLVVTTSRTSRVCRQAVECGQLIRVFRHVLVRAEYLRDAGTWEFSRRVNVVRALGVAIVLGDRVVLSHQSAADVWGVDHRDRFLPVHVCAPVRWGGSRTYLPGIRVPGGRWAPGVPLVRHVAAIPDDQLIRLAGVLVCDLPIATVQCAGGLPPCDGIVIVSGALRALSVFGGVGQAEGRRREEAWRQHLFTLLDRAGPGARNCRRARAVIEAADAACESVAERILLWILKARGFTVETQVRFTVNGRERRVDFLLRRPGRHPDIALEFDGNGKYGELAPEILASVWQEKRRQMDLEAKGLVFLRFAWDDLADPERIARIVAGRCGMDTVPRMRKVLVA